MSCNFWVHAKREARYDDNYIHLATVQERFVVINLCLSQVPDLIQLIK